MTKLIVVFEVLKVHSRLSLSNHLNNSFRKKKKRYGLRVSPCIVPLWMEIGFVFVKCMPMNVVQKVAYMLPINSIVWVAKIGHNG